MSTDVICRYSTYVYTQYRLFVCLFVILLWIGAFVQSDLQDKCVRTFSEQDVDRVYRSQSNIS